MTSFLAAPALHVTWFVDPARYPVDWSLVLSTRTALLLGACAAALAGAFVLQRLAGDPNWPDLGLFRAMAVGAPTLVAVQSAVTLVYYGSQPALLGPNERLGPGAAGLALGALQVLVAFAFITGLLDWLAAAVLALLVLLGFFLEPPLDAVANLYWAGIATTVFLVGRQGLEHGRLRSALRRLDPRWAARSVAILRVTTGIAIIAPALREKVWSPAIGAAFLAQHPNFNLPLHVLGLSWFTDDRFVLAAGIAEAVIGVLLVSGLMTRVVIVAMFVPFNVTVPFLPPTELLGHLPIFAVMYVLLVHGAGVAPGARGAGAERLAGSPAPDPGRRAESAAQDAG